jgi:hypothetical protein
VRLDDAAPAILRTPDGQQQRGKLEVVSLSGGLLNVPHPLEQGSRSSLLFVTDSGPVMGAVEMLSPVSSDHQAFRFVEIEKDDKSRLRAAVQSHAAIDQDAWIEKFRAGLNQAPERRGFFRSLFGSLI